MTFDDFIGKWNDKGVDFDGAYGDQCMDLMHQYCVEVLGLTDGRILAAPAAKDVWNTNVFGKDKFDAIANTPTGVPQKGDIILWGTGIGQYGHVAIFLDGDANKFRSFDQNFPTGSKCHLQEHNYTGVLGWLRYKKPEAMVTITQRELDEIRLARDQHYNDLNAAKATIDNLNQIINDKNRTLSDLQSEVSSLKDQVLNLEGRVESLSNQAKKVPELEKLLQTAESGRLACLTAQESQNKSIAQLKKTSYLTASVKVLLKEISRRFLKLGGEQ